MSLGPVIESFFVAQSLNGMDLSRGVPSHGQAAVELKPKEGKNFEGILKEQGQANVQERAQAKPLVQKQEGLSSNRPHKEVDEEPIENEQSEADSQSQDEVHVENKDVSAEPKQEPENSDSEEDVDTEVAILSQQIVANTALAQVIAPMKKDIEETQDSSILQASIQKASAEVQIEKTELAPEASAVDLKDVLPMKKADEPKELALDSEIQNPMLEVAESSAPIAKQVQESANPMKPEHLIAALKAKSFGVDKLHQGASEKDAPEVKASDKALNLEDQFKIDILKYSEDKGLEQEPQMDLKQFSDRLWLQQKLGSEVNLDSFKDQLVKLEASNSPQPLIKNNLMDEMKPLLMKVMTTEKGGEMSLQLMPAHLGMLKIQIQQMNKDISISMQADNAAAHRALSSQVSELKSELQKNGLEVQHVSVSMVSGKNQVESQKAQAGEQQQKEQPHQQSSQGRDQSRDSRREKGQRDFADEGWKEFFV